jgi:putative transposase
VARSFFEQAIERNGAPEKVTIDKSGSNVAALEAINAELGKPIVVRQIKYLNNIVEQDRRAVKRRTRPMLGFKDLRSVRILLSGIELMHMIRKGQMKDGGKGQTCAPGDVLDAPRDAEAVKLPIADGFEKQKVESTLQDRDSFA